MPGHCWERNQSEPEDLGAKVKCERTFASLKEAVGDVVRGWLRDGDLPSSGTKRERERNKLAVGHLWDPGVGQRSPEFVSL